MNSEVPIGPATQRKYRWPWYLLGFVIAGIVLSVLWMSWEIRRTQRIRELNAIPAMRANSTN